MRRTIKILIGLVAVLAVAALSLWLMLEHIANSAGTRWLREHGITKSSFTIREMATNQLILEDVKLGSDDNLTADRITITYAPGELRLGKVKDIDVEALALKVNETDDGMSLGELDNLIPASSDDMSDTPTILPFNRLAVNGFIAEINHEKKDLITLGLSQISMEALAEGQAKITLKDGWLKRGEQEFSGLEGDITLASLSPAATLPKQKLKVRYANIGTLLADITLDFTLAEDGQLTIHTAKATWGNGALFAEDAKINIHGTGKQTVILKARDIDLTAVVNVVGIAGLETSGRVQGRLPITYDNGKITVSHGNLSTIKGGGIIHYKPISDAPIQQGQNGQTDLMLQAVENFHYDILALDIHSNAPNSLSVKIHLQGRNPDLYEGKPIHLNINLNGDLVEIIKNTLNIYDIPSRIEESIHAPKS